MNSFSFSAIPLGLGLSAAAHIHLCNRSLAQAEYERQRHIEFSERCQIDIFVQSFSENALLSELQSLLEQTLHINDDSHTCTRYRDQDCLQARTGIAKQRRKTRTPSKVSHGPSPNKASMPTVTDHGSSIVNEEPSLESISGRDRETNGQLSTLQHSPRTNSQECLPKAVSDISLEQVELWIKACKEIRLFQEKRLHRTFAQMSMRSRSEDPSFWTLKTNILASVLIGAVSIVRIIPSTTFWTRFIAPSHFIPTSSANLDLFAAGPTRLMMAHSNSTGTNSYSAAFQFLPIMPTLFFSGIHFFVALRTQWALCKIDQQTRSQRKFAKRTRMLCTTLLLREQRLTYLLQQIKARENNSSSLPLPELPTLPPTPEPTQLSVRTQGSLISSEVLRRSSVSCRNNRVTQLFQSGSCEVDDAILAFTPDLQLLDMERFLRDPVERSNVFKTELEALRQELIVFRAESL